MPGLVRGAKLLALFSPLVVALSVASACVELAERPAALEAFTPAAEGEVPINPKAGDLTSAASGGMLFAQNCLRCHGPQGRGDGPEGVRLPSQPLDLTAPRTRSLRDGDVFVVIRGGRGYMPSWQGRLTDSQIWDLVNYIRTLAEHD